jgi:hypothetical protein
VRAHLERLDAGLARLLHDLAGSDSLVLVSADHGFIDCPPERQVQLADHPGLEACLTLPLCGEPRLAHCWLRPGTRRRFLDYVSTELAGRLQARAAADLVAEGLFGPGPVHPRLLERLGDYCLVAEGDWLIKDRLAGERPYRHLGVHGGLSAAELYVPLVCARV